MCECYDVREQQLRLQVESGLQTSRNAARELELWQGQVKFERRKTQTARVWAWFGWGLFVLALASEIYKYRP